MSTKLRCLDTYEIFSNESIFNSILRTGKILAGLSHGISQDLRGKVPECTQIAMQSVSWGINPFHVAATAYVVKGKLVYGAHVIKSLITNSGIIDGNIRYEEIGDWSKIAGKTKKVTSKKGGEHLVQGWDRHDEIGLGVRIIATMKGESKPREVTLMLSNVSTRFSVLWTTDPLQQLKYSGVRKWAKCHCPDVLLGIPGDDEEDIDGDSVAHESAPNLSDIISVSSGAESDPDAEVITLQNDQADADDAAETLADQYLNEIALTDKLELNDAAGALRFIAEKINSSKGDLGNLYNAVIKACRQKWSDVSNAMKASSQAQKDAQQAQAQKQPQEQQTAQQQPQEQQTAQAAQQQQAQNGGQYTDDIAQAPDNDTAPEYADYYAGQSENSEADDLAEHYYKLIGDAVAMSAQAGLKELSKIGQSLESNTSQLGDHYAAVYKKCVAEWKKRNAELKNQQAKDSGSTADHGANEAQQKMMQQFETVVAMLPDHSSPDALDKHDRAVQFLKLYKDKFHAADHAKATAKLNEYASKIGR